ncbi:MAG: ABC transporter permease subunit [Treponema sp.]|jgi:putative aldouronate transport system permease protein|nr:ABC transporter permease subunit [Treponema sp.]
MRLQITIGPEAIMIVRNAKKRRWTKNDTQLLTLALPTSIWFAIFAYLPMMGALIAFKEFRPASGFIKSLFTSRWLGIENFSFLFRNPMIWHVIRNTLLYNMAIITLGLVVPVTLAIIISEVWNKRLAKFYQTLMFFPFFISWVVVSALVMGFLSYDLGIFNKILLFFGGEKRLWYREIAMWPPFLIFMSQWKGMGYGMVLYLAAITSLDKTVYEAAIIDGATKWQQIRKITLPMLKNIIILMLILSVGRIFSSDFGLFYQIPRNTPSLYETVTTIDVFVYTLLKEASIGMSSASSLVQSTVCCIMTLVVNQVVTKIDPDSAMI